MTSRTHDVIAFASLVTAAIAFPPDKLNIATLGVALIGNIIGALIPDMDQATNKLWALLPGGNDFAKLWRHVFLKHRTITHSLLGAFLLYHLLQFILPKLFNQNYIDIQIVFVSIMIGFMSHLLADFVTKDGLPLFFPLHLKVGFPPISALRLTTGSWVEKFLVFPGVIIYLGWLVTTYQETIKNIFRLVI